MDVAFEDPTIAVAIDCATRAADQAPNLEPRLLRYVRSDSAGAGHRVREALERWEPRRCEPLRAAGYRFARPSGLGPHAGKADTGRRRHVAASPPASGPYLHEAMGHRRR